MLRLVGRAALRNQRCQCLPLSICQNVITSFVCHDPNIGIDLKG